MTRRPQEATELARILRMAEPQSVLAICLRSTAVFGYASCGWAPSLLRGTLTRGPASPRKS